MARMVVELFQLMHDPSPFYFFSGEGLLEFEGNLYTGVGNVVSVSPQELKQGEPDRRISFSVANVNPTLRQQSLLDPGPIEIIMNMAYSKDKGKTWIKIPVEYRGRMSSPKLDPNTATFSAEVETLAGDTNFGNIEYWSDEYHRQSYPDDKFFEYQKQLASGKVIRWQ